MMQGTLPGARRRGRPRTAWMDNIKTWTRLSAEESIRMTEDRDKWREYVLPSDRGRLKNRTETRACKYDESTSCRRCIRAACAGAPPCGSYRRLLASGHAARAKRSAAKTFSKTETSASRDFMSRSQMSRLGLSRTNDWARSGCQNFALDRRPRVKIVLASVLVSRVWGPIYKISYDNRTVILR